MWLVYSADCEIIGSLTFQYLILVNSAKGGYDNPSSVVTVVVDCLGLADPLQELILYWFVLISEIG